jgi:hypothetical protein
MRQEGQSVQIIDEAAEISRRLFAQPVKKPSVAFGDDKQGGDPSRACSSKHLDSLRMMPVPFDDQSDEYAGIQKNQAAHGRSRPYTTWSTLTLSSMSPSTIPAYRIHGILEPSRATISAMPCRHSSENDTPWRLATRLARL